MTKTEATKGYLALGGNLGDTRLIFRTALLHLCSIPETKLLGVASLYRTPAHNCWRACHFLNTVCAFSTTLPLEIWMEHVERIERQLGKWPKPKEAPRCIDLDLLFWDKERIEGRWQVPHPRWHMRPFVVRPLIDLTSHIDVPINSDGAIQTILLQPLLEQLSNHTLIRKVAW